uniref:Gypsy retrotransposon integrase-like protein 1 n=1 Tax=Salmo trutta TaxID=8032 RepID=A0A674DZP4_SALTR
MAEFNLPPPAPFLAVPGEPPVPWNNWLDSFNTYIEAMDLSTISDKRRTALLRHCLGTEGQRIFRALGSAPTFTAAVSLLRNHFAGKERVLLRRYRLRKRHQRPGESIQSYVANLRDLASSCNYGTLQDEIIRDQLIEGTLCEKTREKLLLESDNLQLDGAIKIALQVEAALECSTMLTDRSAAYTRPPAILTQQLQPEQAHYNDHALCMASHVDSCMDTDTGMPVQQAHRQTNRSSCGNCGASSHNSRASNCPARGKICKNCSKYNHFAKVCRSAPATSSTQHRPLVSSHSQHERTEIRTVSTNHVSFRTCTVQLGEVGLPLLLDTGAAVSLLNLATYYKFFSHLPLQQPSTALCGYGRSKIDIVGTLQVPVHYGTKHLPSFTFHVAKRGANLLGLDLFTGLGFTLRDDSGSAIHQVTCTWQQNWPTLFDGLGCLTAFTHRPLVNPEVTPVMQPLRRIPFALRDDVTKDLQAQLDAGIIEPVNAAPWISNLVIATKKSGGIRTCVDLRAVNKAVVPDKYPLPTAEELTAQFHGSTIFTKLDLRQGYLQVPLHAASRDLTTFVTHAGVFRYTRMPFGLNSAPSCFQKVMSTILAGIPGVAVYLDDIVVHGPDLHIHDCRLHRVFSALLQNNLTLNGGKCTFAAPAVEFVGFRLSAKGIAPLMSNIEAVHRIPEPTSASQVASFLGMTAYYLRFLPHYSQTTAPLRQLLKKDEPWAWTAACSDAVRSLKSQLSTAPVLAHFDPVCPTIVTCDASAGALGAVLSQLQNGIERPVAFASRALSPTEQRYSVGEREALACVWACERWHLYLYGRLFTLRTDHQSLTTLLSASGTGHKPLRLHRWADRLRQYDYQLKFTPGRDNVVADLLSRSFDAPTPTVLPDDNETDLVQMLYAPLQSVVSLEELKQASEQDPTLSTLRTYIRTGWPAHVLEELATFARVKHELSCWEEVCVSRGFCTVVPSGLRARVLSMAHEGHLGIVKVKQRCRDLVWWPGIDHDIEALVRDCAACLLSGKTGQSAPPPLQPLAWPSRPWEHIQLDICGEIHGHAVPHHQRFLVVVYDLHSKWPEVVPVGTVTAQAIVDILDSLFTRWGLPLTLTTDNGPQLISAEFSSYLSNKGIKHIRTAYYNPQANGGVERFNQTLKNGIRAHLVQGCTFQTALNQTLMHYRASKHTTTQASPASLMLGREMELPLDRLRTQRVAEPATRCTQEKQAVTRHQREMKQRFDKAHRVKKSIIQVSDWVRARRPQRCNKMASFWSDPLQVS